MELKVCDVCLKNKTPLSCDICSNVSCRHCSVFIDETSFEFLSLLPDHIKDKMFCPNCYDEKIAEEFFKYQEMLNKAKDVDIYDDTQGAETRLMRRVEKVIKVIECDGREEALIRLAFLAVEKGYDTIVDVNIKSIKSGQDSYIKKVWNGSAIPVDSKKRK